MHDLGFKEHTEDGVRLLVLDLTNQQQLGLINQRMAYFKQILTRSGV